MWRAILITIVVMLSVCSNVNRNDVAIPLSSQENKVERSTEPNAEPSVSSNIGVNKELSDEGNAKLCMKSLTRERQKYSSTMYSVLSSLVYLNKKFGLSDTDIDQTELILAKYPQPIFFSEKADIKLIYPKMSYKDTSIEIQNSEDKFNEMVKNSPETNNPREVDAVRLKGLAGCSILPFDDITYSITGGATQISGDNDETSPAYDYLNTLNMWSSRANAYSAYESRKEEADKNNDMFENDQFVYIYCPDCEIDRLILQHIQPGIATELVFSEIESENGWHVFVAETRESPWFEYPPYIIDYTEGYSQFILETKGQSIPLTNQYYSSSETKYTDVIQENRRNSLAGIYYAGEASLTIDSYKDGKIEGTVSRASNNLSKIAEASFSGEVIDNQLKFTFKGDGYGTKGISHGTLYLKDDLIKLDLKIKSSEGEWSLLDGELIFTKSLRTYLYE